MLGSFENSAFETSLSNARLEALDHRSRSRTPGNAIHNRPETPDQLLDREWSELPYAMMRITAARRPWDNKRVYWRDRTVQLGDIDLNLTRARNQSNTHRYAATYKLDELRRDFALQPSLEDDVLRWSAPDLCDARLTTAQLAEKLLTRLVTFYTLGLYTPTPTSSASPGRSSLPSARSPHSCPPPR